MDADFEISLTTKIGDYLAFSIASIQLPITSVHFVASGPQSEV